MNNDVTLQTENAKPSRLRYIIPAAALLLIIVALFVSLLNWEPKPDPESEKILRQSAAIQLHKEPNDLTDEDFAKITEINIGPQKTVQITVGIGIQYGDNELSDIRLLVKFKNLKKLNLGKIKVPVKKIPQWIRIIAKLGHYDINKKYAIDLSPLEKLHNLEELKLGGEAVRDLKPLAGLNLKHLQLLSSPVSDIKPLMSIEQLQSLQIYFCDNILKKDLEEWEKLRPNLQITGTYFFNNYDISKKQNDFLKNLYSWRHIIVSVILFLIIVSLVYIYFSKIQKKDHASES